MKIAAIDLGTNSFLCLIAAVDDATESLKIIEDVCKVVRLGEKVHENRYFLPQALARAEEALAAFQKIFTKHRVEKVVATATSAARDVSNGGELLKLGERYGIPITIIEGKREAELSFMGALSGLAAPQKENILVVDVGGGSTELIYKESGKPLQAQSFDVGCVRLTELFLKKDPVDSGEYDALSERALSTLRSFGAAFGDIHPQRVIAVAGTPTTLACVDQGVDFAPPKLDGYALTKKKITELALRLGKMPLSERKKVKGLEPLRADVIVAGAALLLSALEVAHLNELLVSTRGLRYGVALAHKEFS